MITELVFENALTELHPTEIAALLSSMVFEQKNASEPRLIDTLEKVKFYFLLCIDVYSVTFNVNNHWSILGNPGLLLCNTWLFDVWNG